MTDDMPRPVTGLWLKANGVVEDVVVNSIGDIQRMVGGYFEYCEAGLGAPFNQTLFQVYWDEDGKAKHGNRVNWGVTKLLQFFGKVQDDMIVGDCVIVGPSDSEGEDTSLDEHGAMFIRSVVMDVNKKVQVVLDDEFARIVSAEYGVKYERKGSGRRKRKKRKDS